MNIEIVGRNLVLINSHSCPEHGPNPNLIHLAVMLEGAKWLFRVQRIRAPSHDPPSNVADCAELRHHAVELKSPKVRTVSAQSISSDVFP